MNRNTQTPWGFSDSAKELAPGIIFYSTPSHGGFHLSESRLREMPSNIRAVTTWAGGPWYEEDADWALVCLAFPQYFSETDYANAVKTCANYDRAAHLVTRGMGQIAHSIEVQPAR